MFSVFWTLGKSKLPFAWFCFWSEPKKKWFFGFSCPLGRKPDHSVYLDETFLATGVFDGKCFRGVFERISSPSSMSPKTGKICCWFFSEHLLIGTHRTFYLPLCNLSVVWILSSDTRTPRNGWDSVRGRKCFFSGVDQFLSDLLGGAALKMGKYRRNHFPWKNF